jgi:uncharacterized repeat protein (TIGR03803 family)
VKHTHVWAMRIAALLVVIAVASAAPAQIYTDLYNLGTNAGEPINPAWLGTFAQGRDGNLYSTAPAGGEKGFGAIFQLTPAGSMKVLYSFQNTNDGVFPNSGLTLGTDGSLYGTTPAGGNPGYGTIFKITTSGVFTVLHGFNGNTEGVAASAPPIQGPDGNFYGTTSNGGGAVFGTIYKMTPAGNLTVIHTFDGTLRYPYALILGTDGNFYGTAGGGSGSPYGAVFKATPSGKVTLLHGFTSTDGQTPLGAIIQASDGNFYGTTSAGGSGGGGVAYKMTPAGVLTDLFSFSNNGLGMAPRAGLVQATDGNFYGATTTDPGVCFGTLFQLTSSGTYTNLVFLTNVVGQAPGSSPQVSLLQHTNGTFYGDTAGGGSGNIGCITCGVLYSLDMDLGPFVSIVNWMGKVGQTIEFVGQGLTGTTKVSFNGTSASFKVVSDTYLTATLPVGAKTGFVKVTTPGGVRTSNRKFLVLPTVLSFTPPSGPVGTSVTITGTGFIQAQGVGFGDTIPAQFTVDSDSQITATVPQGAKTGPVGVKTPGGTGISKDKFTVTP